MTDAHKRLHAAEHANGGEDEIDVTGLTGTHDAVTVGTGLDVTGQLVTLDLSEVAAGGELGGNMDAPTVDATHAGGTHAATQAAAEATAAGALSTHAGASDPHPGYLTQAEGDGFYAPIAEPIAAAHIVDTGDAHDASAISIADAANDFTATDVEGALAELQSDAEAHIAALSAHSAEHTTFDDSGLTYVFGVEVQGALAAVDGALVGFAGHISDTGDAHDASAISILDAANDFTATDVEGALAELQADAETHTHPASGASYAQTFKFS